MDRHTADGLLAQSCQALILAYINRSSVDTKLGMMMKQIFGSIKNTIDFPYVENNLASL